MPSYYMFGLKRYGDAAVRFMNKLKEIYPDNQDYGDLSSKFGQIQVRLEKEVFNIPQEIYATESHEEIEKIHESCGDDFKLLQKASEMVDEVLCSLQFNNFGSDKDNTERQFINVLNYHAKQGSLFKQILGGEEVFDDFLSKFSAHLNEAEIKTVKDTKEVFQKLKPAAEECKGVFFSVPPKQLARRLFADISKKWHNIKNNYEFLQNVGETLIAMDKTEVPENLSKFYSGISAKLHVLQYIADNPEEYPKLFSLKIKDILNDEQKQKYTPQSQDNTLYSRLWGGQTVFGLINNGVIGGYVSYVSTYDRDLQYAEENLARNKSRLKEIGYDPERLDNALKKAAKLNNKICTRLGLIDALHKFEKENKRER